MRDAFNSVFQYIGEWLIKSIGVSLVDLYFKSVEVHNQLKLPKSGGTIIVAKHSNQFVDALVLLGCLDRYPRFLMAEKSVNRPIVGEFSRIAGVVSVKRGQDLKYTARGTIYLKVPTENHQDIETVIVEGTDTYFLVDCRPSDSICVGGLTLVVKQVSSDNVLTATCKSRDFKMTENSTFSVIPKVDQAAVYSRVTKALKQGDLIGIFPEGGSHDQTQLLPLKPGVAIMALGAAASGVDVTIAPIGICYVDPAALRSKVTLQIGDPIHINEELLETYRLDKRAAITELMQIIRERIENCTVLAADRRVMRAVSMARSLYPPVDPRCTGSEDQRLLGVFSRLFLLEGDSEGAVALQEEMDLYGKLLTSNGYRDDVIPYLLLSDFEFTWKLIFMVPSLVKNLLTMLALSPICGLMRAVTSVYADIQRRHAVAESSVKLSGEDVIASYRIIIITVSLPVISAIWGFITGWFLFSSWLVILIWVSVFSYKSHRLFECGDEAYDEVRDAYTLIKLYSCKIREQVVVVNSMYATDILVNTRNTLVIRLRSFVHDSITSHPEDVRYIELREELDALIPRRFIVADDKRINMLSASSRPFSSEFCQQFAMQEEEIL